MLRDYSLLGPSAKDAEKKGLAAAKWYHSDISREDMKDLMPVSYTHLTLPTKA